MFYPYGRSYYGQLEDAKQIYEVQMGMVGFNEWRNFPTMGTKGLGSCSVVVIASQHAGILAHIKPEPGTATNPYAGDNVVREVMRQLKITHDQYKRLGFFPHANSSVVCAYYQGSQALPAQINIMKAGLREMGYEPVIREYHVPANEMLIGAGEVVVDSRSAGMPVVYVESRVV
ncbi:hypothetical protein BJX99DRAFT_254106 [Aspergillus californicus]